MTNQTSSRRDFLKLAGTVAPAALIAPESFLGLVDLPDSVQPSESGPPDYVLRISAGPLEIASNQIVSTITYDGKFPGPLLRFKERQAATVEVHNDTDTPEQLHWHGQMISTDVDGPAEEGTPFIPAHGMRRIVFTPGPPGFRFYHKQAALGLISTRGSTVAKSDPSTSNQRTSLAAMTAKCFWY
jgi:FtsP/CotA-like multicopper oxidase with cupredoxin domain